MEYLKEILSFLAGAITGGIAVKWSIDRSTRTTTTQSRNVAGGDVAGRDINKK
jgi:hypothetical protein